MTTAQVVPGAGLNWDATSRDYARHRPGYPDSYFEIAFLFGIGRAGQRILDLGAGTGALALQFSRQGAQVVALDASPGQLESLKEKAARERLEVRILHARAEETGLDDASFDAVSASMCWGYFDHAAMAREVPRLLKPGGLLLVSSLVWDESDPISKATAALLAEYNPASARPKRGRRTGPSPDLTKTPFHVRSFHSWVEDLRFTRESWRGRIRASKWVGAALDPGRVEAFDREHELLLRAIAPERFPIPHRITMHVVDAAW